MTPGASQGTPKRVPRAAKTGPRAAKITPRDSKIGPRCHSGPSRIPKISPRGNPSVPRALQDLCKRFLGIRFAELPDSFPRTCWSRSRWVRAESFSDTDISTDFLVATKRACKTSWEVPQRNHERMATFRINLLPLRTSPLARRRLRAQPTG